MTNILRGLTVAALRKQDKYTLYYIPSATFRLITFSNACLRYLPNAHTHNKSRIHFLCTNISIFTFSPGNAKLIQPTKKSPLFLLHVLLLVDEFCCRDRSIKVNTKLHINVYISAQMEITTIFIGPVEL